MLEKDLQEKIVLAKEEGERCYHGVGCLYNNHHVIAYDYGVISLVSWEDSDTVLERIGKMTPTVPPPVFALTSAAISSIVA